MTICHIDWGPTNKDWRHCRKRIKSVSIAHQLLRYCKTEQILTHIILLFCPDLLPAVKTKGIYSKKNKKKKKEKRRSHPSPHSLLTPHPSSHSLLPSHPSSHSTATDQPEVENPANDSISLDATEELHAGKDIGGSFQVCLAFTFMELACTLIISLSINSIWFVFVWGFQWCISGYGNTNSRLPTGAPILDF